MVHILGQQRPPDDGPHDEHLAHLEELLDQYASATRLSAFAEAGAVRGEIISYFQNHRLLQDGEFVCEGVLFGVFFRSRGSMTARQYRNPAHIFEFMGQLMERLIGGIGAFLEQQAKGGE